MMFTLEIDAQTVTDAGRNGAKGDYHRANRAAQTIREQVCWTVKGLAAPQYDRLVDVRVEQHSRTAHHRDSDNVSGPAKAIIDGMVDAGVLAEDCPCHVRDVTLRQVNGCPDVGEGVHEFAVTITEVDA